MQLMHTIQQEYRKFRKEDFNHREPNTIFLSIDVFHDILRNGKPEYAERNPLDPNQWFILGMDVCVVDNKRLFIHVCFV